MFFEKNLEAAVVQRIEVPEPLVAKILQEEVADDETA